MNTLPPSTHVPRSHRVHFTGRPSLGHVEVRCGSATDFDLVRLDHQWYVLSPSNTWIRSMLPILPQRSAYLAYIAATSALWDSPPPKGIDERSLYQSLHHRHH